MSSVWTQALSEYGKSEALSDFAAAVFSYDSLK